MLQILLIDRDAGRAQEIIRLLGPLEFPVEHRQSASFGPIDEANVVILADEETLKETTTPLEFVARLRETNRESVLVVLVGQTDDQTLAGMIRAGAATFVRRRLLAEQLVDTITKLLAILTCPIGAGQPKGLLVRSEFHYLLENDLKQFPSVLAGIEDELRKRDMFTASEITRIAIALHEAVDNAVFHGNLEVSSALRDSGHPETYTGLAEQRRQQSPYRERRISLSVRLTDDEATFIVRDDGPGFDPQSVPDPTLPENLSRPSGRGLLLIRSFFDEVQHYGRGNEVRLRKLCQRPAAT